jgi:hypothetical protein
LIISSLLVTAWRAIVGAAIPFVSGKATRIAGEGLFQYLRHIDSDAFTKLMSFGAKNGDEITTLLNRAGTDTVIRGMTDRAGNQIILQAGNRDFGLRHIIGRHLTGEISGGYTTFFSNTLKVGDITDLIGQTIRNGRRTIGDNSNWVYKWTHETWGEINVVTNEFNEVISAFPTK